MNRDARPGTEGPRPEPFGTASPWKTLIAVSVGSFMTILDVTVVNVAIHSIQQEFGASTADVQWVVSGYALALGVATPLAGALGERLGTKKVYLISLGCFAGASLLCGLAPSLPLLIVARVVQGLAGGFALPLGSAKLFTAFPAAKRGLAFGVFGIVLVFAPTVGPLLGGAFVDAGMLRWIFFINVPIGALGVLLGSRFLTPDGPRAESAPRIHLPSVVLVCVGFSGLLLGATLLGSPSGSHSSSRGTTLAAFAVGALALVVLVRVQLRSASPLLNLRLYRVRTYWIGSAINALGQVPFFGTQFLLPLSMQVVRGVSALDAGLALLPLALSSGAAGVLAGRVRDRWGPRLPLAVGFLLLAAGIAMLRARAADPDPRGLVWPLLLAGAGAGAIPPTTQVTALSDVPRESVGSGTALLQATQRVCQALGVAALAAIVARGVTAPANSHVFIAQYAAGLSAAYTVALYVSLGCAVLATLLPGWPIRSTEAIPETGPGTGAVSGQKTPPDS
ncbi:DHA2 family efflux MFS transporter permease subunit [Streptomyces sp. NBC_01387]|uniref:DHA2 family efflux MFS transporter permease subunit n=1 Tax=unclassified Streptomyces TaxID=2593676 RepID=UPI002023F81C|nr:MULTISPECIES: DHA2 family efflux MFS transporter permease subunit [unclassified Streptomyces]MCX4553526.1 DHA2 family efflux MFS transporter permease subunit [Streptomyces sp. NBC_01500]WSC18478.1 DHA2 family efflux MFS transporter permease subunit [Streptomyces sp. NBC_01766]WSV52519.1 DHA2 family efflux MFS transporter permease subunit [Streptomyces sp. NBC_01014]